MLPQIALGQTQSSILANAYFENDILDLINVFVPPLMSSTMNADSLAAMQGKDRSKSLRNPTDDTESAGGRPTKESQGESVSEKTIQNKESQNKDTIFYMSPTLDTDYGKIYPTSQGNVSVGCYSRGINYKDSIVFLSRNGLEGITGNVSYEQSVSHKSSMIDSKMRNMSNYDNPSIAEYNGYLLIGVTNNIFLADYRQQFQGTNGNEYEWYLWEFPITITLLKNYLVMLAQV